MNDQVLTILKGCLLALLYLFLLRVVIVVSRELRGTPAPAPTPPRPAPAPTPAPTTSTPARSKGFVLTVREPEIRRGEQLLVTDESTIGRGGGCALALPDDTFASSLHARLFTRDDKLWIEDLGSTNGTTVNNRRIGEPTRLRKGDRVVVGQTVLEVGK